jgi:hypothetical protein
MSKRKSSRRQQREQVREAGRVDVSNTRLPLSSDEKQV